MSTSMTFLELQANLLLIEEEHVNEENGPPMAPTVLKCNCSSLCDCQDCIDNPFPTDGSIKMRTLSWCPTTDQGQFINCFIGQYGSTFYYTWPCGLSAHCNGPRAPMEKESQLARNFVATMLELPMLADIL
ncbi:unnamed protein product [Meganyctiphanes norvegica]|uniref:Uncharacterized protein n=1 Tax=Meganyctiphanes norvegica TaxID=48144 RepID=A0AAV2SVB2_MEGNR